MDIVAFEPRTPNDHSADDFSKRASVFATTDSIWSIYYAVLDRSFGKRHLNAALQFREQERWSQIHYFFSVVFRSMEKEPWRPGFVYLVPRSGFEQQPPYAVQSWTVLDPHFANEHIVKPICRLRVHPSAFPLLGRVRVHEDEAIIRAQAEDPLGFPWPYTFR